MKFLLSLLVTASIVSFVYATGDLIKNSGSSTKGVESYLKDKMQGKF